MAHLYDNLPDAWTWIQVLIHLVPLASVQSKGTPNPTSTVHAYLDARVVNEDTAIMIHDAERRTVTLGYGHSLDCSRP